jgi:hypothetical protein
VCRHVAQAHHVVLDSHLTVVELGEVEPPTQLLETTVYGRENGTKDVSLFGSDQQSNFSHEGDHTGLGTEVDAWTLDGEALREELLRLFAHFAPDENLGYLFTPIHGLAFRGLA